VASNIQRAHDIRFIYFEAELTEKSSYGKGYASMGDTGYYEFGPILVARANGAFSKYGVNVLSSRFSRKGESHEPLNYGSQDTANTPTLLIFPVAASASTGSHGARVSHVFEARLHDPVKKKILWKAAIDTSTWTGTDFINKNGPKTMYDEAYADQLFEAVAQQMKKDGAI